MNPKEEKRLLKLYEEVDSDEYIDSDIYYGESDSYHPENDDVDSDDSNIESEVLETLNEEDHVSAEVSPESDADDNIRENADPVEGSDNEDTNENGWNSDTLSIDDFSFDYSQMGIKLFGDLNSSPCDIFTQLWNGGIMDLLVKSTNHYGKSLTIKSRPKTRHSRSITSKEEVKTFLGLCL
uniref:Uncharacterized protein LOC114326253 n=1 Tax=Diabrotica virgifera virgifera TaxID=50390 RepID=A0A6P7F3W1_DIAVI